MLEIVKYIKEFGLDKTVLDFKLKMRDYDSKILLKYDQIASPMGERIVQEARGIILEKETWNIMMLSFYKFFNNGEGHAAKIDWSSAHVLEKLDGSLINLYWDWNLNEWCVATTGTAEAEGLVNNKDNTSFADLFWRTIHSNNPKFKISGLDKDCVYMFELTTPYNIVVKPHGTSSVTLLGARNRVTLKEATRNELLEAGKVLYLDVVKSYDLNAKDFGKLIKTFENMPWTEEGYIVVDDNHNRVKVKNPAYVSAHYTKGKMGEHHIMGIIKTNEVDEFIVTFPDRKDEILKLQTNYNNLIVSLDDLWSKLVKPKNITPKEKKRFAMDVFKLCGDEFKEFSGLFFMLANGKVDTVREFLSNYDNKKLYKIL